MEYYVSKPTSFMYLCPDCKSEVTDELLYGTCVTAKDESYAGYVFCKTEYGYSGHVDISDLSPRKEQGTKFVVTSPFCDLYEYPEYRYAPKMTLTRGSVIEANEKDGNFGKFTCLEWNGNTYFAPSMCIEKQSTIIRFDDEKSKRSQIVKTAFSYLGVPYRWGGKSTLGIDCSGLCFMAYTLCGLSLYRDAEPDARYVKKIPFSDLKPADLIYYNGHVTMYIGMNEYIHSSATLGGVRICSFDEKSAQYYPKLKSDIVCCARSLYLS